MKFPAGSLASAITLSKPAGWNGTNRPRLVRSLAADMSDMVMTSTAMRPAAASCWKRRMHLAAAGAQQLDLDAGAALELVGDVLSRPRTGVEVYQVTAPSRLAAASSTGSGVNSCAKRAAAEPGDRNQRSARSLPA